MRTRKTLKGVFPTYKKLRDGTTKTYWYHRATGTRLPGEFGSAEFLAALLKAETLHPNQTETLVILFREYLLSPKFDRKAQSTKKEYRRMLAHLETAFGDMPIKALESLKARGIFIDYQEEIGRKTEREADNRMSVLSAVLSYAVDKGRIARNPIAGFERLHHADRSEIIWTEGDIERFMKNAPIELQRAMILALHTGQRYGDLLKLRWSDFDGISLNLTQSKTSARVQIHCTEALLRMLVGTPRSGPYILTRADGRPWFTTSNDKALSKAWHAHMEASGFYPKRFEALTAVEKRSHLHLNDLRGTAVTLLAEAGCTVPQIVAITGHTLQSATRILERYLSKTPALSRAAMMAFQNAPETEFANRMQTSPSN